MIFKPKNVCIKYDMNSVISQSGRVENAVVLHLPMKYISVSECSIYSTANAVYIFFKGMTVCRNSLSITAATFHKAAAIVRKKLIFYFVHSCFGIFLMFVTSLATAPD